MPTKKSKRQATKTRKTLERAGRELKRAQELRLKANSQAIILRAPQQLTSAVVEVEKTIENLERVRRFVSKALNRDLQRELAKLEKRKATLKADEYGKIERALREKFEIDWGTIPGVDNPFLKQPGAEKFLFWLNLRPVFTKRERELPDGHLEMIASVTVRSKKTGEEVFEGPDCSCSTMESNYRFRWVDAEAKPLDEIIEQMKRQGTGRFKRKRVWKRGVDMGIQTVWQERVDNPNVHDERNKVRQIGEKRALVKCIRNMGAISEIFTADPSEWVFEDEEQVDPRDEQDFTPSGRHIYQADGSSPSGRYQDTQKPPARVAPAAQTAPAGEPVKPRIPQQKPMGKVTLTWPANKDGCAYLSGDLSRILPVIQNAMVCQWLERRKSYAIPETEAITLHDLVISRGYEYEEFSEAKRAVQTAASPTSRDAVSEKPVAPMGAPANPLPGAPAIGIIKRAVPKTTRKGEILDIQWGSLSTGCWNKALWPALVAGTDKEAELLLDEKGKYVVGIKRIGERHYEDNVPVIQIGEDRARTTGELFR